MDYAQVFLKPKKLQSICRKHPWVFSGALNKVEEPLKAGDKVNVVSPDGTIVATGHYGKGSIAVRILSFSQKGIDQAFYFEKLKGALQLRRQLGFIDNENTNAYRLVHGEGDELPGQVIDLFNKVAVVQTHSTGMSRDYELISAALKDLYGEELEEIYHRKADKKDGDPEAAERYTEIKENGHNFRVDYGSGQKTGFFLDQRNNRDLLGRYVNDRKVLNVFSYTGGFSVYALQAGARQVFSLDSSAKALELLEQNLELIPPASGSHKTIHQDAKEYLSNEDFIKEQHEIIVLDPPAFAKHRSARHRAVQAYKRLNMQAIKNIAPGGILFTFSCSQVVNTALFNHTIASAAMETGRQIRVLHYLSQAEDHPISLYHPEGEYLKGLVLAIE